MLRKDNLPMSIPQKKPMIYICITALTFKLQSQDKSVMGWGGVQPRKTTSRCYMYVLMKRI